MNKRRRFMSRFRFILCLSALSVFVYPVALSAAVSSLHRHPSSVLIHPSSLILHPLQGQQPRKINPEALKKYVGRYELEAGIIPISTLDVSLENNELWVKPS